MSVERVTVLLHGSCHGPWCWDDVSAALHAIGVTATAPQLSMSPGTKLSDHIEQVRSALPADADELRLVGHSYAGMLLAELAASDSRVRECVYLDAFVPAPGECAFDLLGPIGAELRALAQSDPSGCFPPPPAVAFGVGDPMVARRIDERLVPMPAGTHSELVRVAAIEGDGSASPATWRSRFVRCGRFPAFAMHAERALGAGWPVDVIDADHEVMVTAPDLLVSTLRS
jgi:pimeloyl-ACP methyl ester carboxylesterase